MNDRSIHLDLLDQVATSEEEARAVRRILGPELQRELGYLHDFDHIDMAPWPARAGVDGVVLAQAWVSPIPRGQHIVVVGRELV